MIRRLLPGAVVLLLLAGGGAWFRPRPNPAAPERGRLVPRAARPDGCFPTAEDARRYAVARLWASEGARPAGDPYSTTFTRRFTPLTGEPADFYLVEEPSRELGLADGFLRHGFSREALAHLDALLTFHPDSPEAAVARSRIDDCRKATVLGLVAPLSVVTEDEAGSRYVAAAAQGAGAPPLERIQDAYLGAPVRVAGPLKVVGFVDDAGAVVLGKWPSVNPALSGASDGALACGRLYYRLHHSPSLFDLEARVKCDLLKEMAGRIDTTDEENLPRFRKIADALLYIGFPEDATALLAEIEETSPPPPPAGPASPLRLDEQWRAAVQDHPRFALETKSSVTGVAELPLDVDAKSIDRLTFSFARLEGPLPVREKDVKPWLEKATAKTSHAEVLPVASGRSALRLPVRMPGTYRVTAEARGLSCSFLVVRADLSVDLLAFPGETLFTARREGVTVSSAIKVFGTTGADGLLSFQGAVPGKFCDEHRQCCSSCESCLHHHTNEAVLTAGAPVFVSGAGQFFRATAKIETSEVSKHVPPPPAPILLVYTDRPAYKAGDTMHFRGILRLPRQPLRRTDAVRLDPGREREVALSIRCGDASLFQRTYVTGDHGTFSGEFTLPLSAARAEYSIEVSHADARVARPFQVLDYRKSDYAILLTPESRGVRVEAGYVWGAPVAGGAVRCLVDGKETALEGGLVAMKEGQRLAVEFLREGEKLATKGMTFRGPGSTAAPNGAAPADGPEAAPPAAPTAAPEHKTTGAPKFVAATAKPLYRRGETIEVELTGPWEEAEATVVVGDSQLYDLVRVPLRGGRGAARFPVRAIYDPGVSVFALCNGQEARADVLVRTNLMPVSIDAPAKARPGERVEVTLRADPDAAISLSAVDESIYMIAEDETPEIYTHFYPPRPSAIAWGRCENFEYDGESHKVEKPLEGPHFRTGERVGERLARRAGAHESVGIGFSFGGGSGGRYGGTFGGRENLVARGGGVRATESAVLASLRALGRSQNADGSWSASFVTAAGTVSDSGATALALLAYLGAGYSHLSRDEYPDPANPGGILKFGDIVKKAQSWLESRQGETGLVGPESGDALLNHALAALALSEHYGMTTSGPLKEPARKAIDFLCSRQSDDGGWHRRDSRARGEILATTFALMALKSAQLSELPFQAGDRPWQFFGQVVDDDGLCGEPPTRAPVAGAMLSQILLRNDRGDPRVIGAAGWLAARKPDWGQADFLGWYLTSLALFRFDGPGGPAWRSWDQPIKNVLVPNQAKGGFWTARGDSIVATALGALTSEVYYRYANVFGVFGGSGAKAAQMPLAPAPRVRVHFPDTAFWAPDLITDAKGESRVTFTFPDQISTTRLTARGVTKDSAAGQATARIAARQPFFVKICGPEFVVRGDEVEVRVEAYNYTPAAVDAVLRLDGADGEKKVRVPPERQASASWRVRATDPAGLRLVARGRAGEREDAMERVLPVRREGREEVVAARRSAETGQAVRFDAAPDAQDLVVKIHPERGTLSQLLDALRYLNAYPYG